MQARPSDLAAWLAARPALGWGLALVLVFGASAADRLLLPPWRAAVADQQAQAAAKALLRPAAPAWPTAVQTPQRTQQLMQRAQREGLVILRATEQPDPASATHRVQLHAQGSYGAVRRFVAQAMADDAALALESLRLQRPTGPAEGIMVDLQWRLLVQPAGGPP